MPDKGLDLNGRDVSADPAMEKVIAAQARANELRREVATLKRDRDLLLQEYQDTQRARSVPHSPAKHRKTPKASSVRLSFGDLHGMRMDRKAVDALLRDVRVLDPDVVVLGGDMMECGGWLAKHQPIGFVALLDYTYQEDLAATNWFLDEAQQAAPHAEMHYLEGQHEDRIERWIVDQVTGHAADAEFLRSLVSPHALLRLEERGIKYYRRSQVYVEGLPRGWMQLGRMYFTHEMGTSRNAARDAVSQTGGNVTYFHTHREDTATRVFPAVGICKAFNPGCLCTMQPVWQNSNPTDWSQGYAIDFIAKSGNFQRVHVPIWRGESLAQAMIERFKS